MVFHDNSEPKYYLRFSMRRRGTIKDTNLIERDPLRYEGRTNDEILIARGENPEALIDFRSAENDLIASIDDDLVEPTFCSAKSAPDDVFDHVYEYLYLQWLDELANDDLGERNGFRDIMSPSYAPDVTVVPRFVGRRIDDLPRRIGSQRLAEYTNPNLIEDRQDGCRAAELRSWKNLRILRQFDRHR
ncbi:MAG: hypothetical protein WCT10_02615 [Patescibacteria group bacterium]|jgi:hypothetical protein